MVKIILLLVALGSLAPVLYAQDNPVPAPSPPPSFKLKGFWMSTADLLTDTNQTGVGQASKTVSTAGTNSIGGFTLDSNGSGIDMTYTNGTWNTGLQPLYLGDWDVHVTNFNGQLYTGVGVYDSSDFRISEPYSGARNALVGFDFGDDSYLKSLFGTEVKWTAAPGVVLGAYVPVAKGDVLGKAYGTNLSSEEAYGWSFLAAQYRLTGLGTAYAGWSGYYRQAYINLSYDGAKPLVAQVGIGYDYHSLAPRFGGLLGYTLGNFSFYTQDQFTLSGDGTNYTLYYGNVSGPNPVYGDSFGYFLSLEAAYRFNGAFQIRVDTDLNNAFDPAYNNPRTGINDKTRAADPFWNVFPNFVLHNEQWVGPCDLQLGFRWTSDLKTNKTTWVVPLTVSVLVL